jgi:hypothetical protein
MCTGSSILQQGLQKLWILCHVSMKRYTLLSNGCINTSIARQREPQRITPAASKKYTTTEEPWRRCFLWSPRSYKWVSGPRLKGAGQLRINSRSWCWKPLPSNMTENTGLCETVMCTV